MGLLPSDEHGDPVALGPARDEAVEHARDQLCAHEILTAYPDAAYLRVAATSIGPDVTGLWDRNGNDLGQDLGRRLNHTNKRELRQLSRRARAGSQDVIDLDEVAGVKRGLFGRRKLRSREDLEQLRQAADL